MNGRLDGPMGRPLNRRVCLVAAASCVCPWPALAKVLPPVLTDGERVTELGQGELERAFLRVQPPPGYRRIAPVVTSRRARSSRSRALPAPPTAYVVTARRMGVPAWLLFGVALQESQMLFGGETLPYPWTLGVGGRAERHAGRQAASEALAGYLDRGVTNVDCGPMQVNWRAHSALLVSATAALDPYRNLAAGARILKSHFAATGSWPQAVGLYHTGSFGSGERRNRAVGYVAGVSRQLSRHGLTLADAAAFDQERRHG